MNSNIKILGIKIGNLKKGGLLEQAEIFLADDKSHQLITLNPEIILLAQQDEEYFHILNHADFVIADGMGLKLAGCFLCKNINRHTGADLTTELLRIAELKKLKIAIVNWSAGLSSQADITAAIKKIHRNLEVLTIDVEREWTAADFASLNSFAPKIIFCALGAPWQEKFIFHYLQQATTPGLGIGVGGTFDFLTGRLVRAPYWLRSIGMEWLWRLKEQPRRWRRIYNATFVFTYKFLVNRYIYPLIYRPNVACMLYKKDSGRYKILLVERYDSSNHWQLPQGGTDGMSLTEAGTKELSEEINCSRFRPLATFPDLWKYEFSIKENENIPKRHQGYKGQKQGLFIAEFLGDDKDIKVNYWDHLNWKWVDSEDLVGAVAEKRQPGVSIFLKHFKNYLNIK